jgi:hypothetical protein
MNRRRQSVKLPANIRGSWTNVDEAGQFTLQPITAGDLIKNVLLDFYRFFWVAFMRNHSISCEYRVTRNAEVNISRGVIVLKQIMSEARAAVKELEAAIQRSPQASHPLREMLQKQVAWQNRLRETLRDCEEVSSFCRFLLVKSVLARTSSLRSYSIDLKEILSDLSRGVTLLESMTINLDKTPVSISGVPACDES